MNRREYVSSQQVCNTMEWYETRDAPVQCILTSPRVHVTPRPLSYCEKESCERARILLSSFPLHFSSASASAGEHRHTARARAPAASCALQHFKLIFLNWVTGIVIEKNSFPPFIFSLKLDITAEMFALDDRDAHTTITLLRNQCNSETLTHIIKWFMLHKVLWLNLCCYFS